jgi:SAM-dependent methyltransferase
MSAAVDFEARYRADPDPWGYATSDYERRKYAATLAACGPGPFARALELGSSIGVFSALLAPRCERLDTLDAAPTAVAAARKRLASHPGTVARLGSIPEDVPHGPFELVIASEILYYLTPARLADTLARVADVLAPDGRLVAVHWRPPGPERPHTAEQVHRLLRRCAWLAPVDSHPHPQYLLDVFERR